MKQIKNKQITLHHDDLPNEILANLGNEIAMDCEMMGLTPIRDKLCLVQLSNDGDDIHLIKFDITKPYNAPNLVKLINDEAKCKIFHFARGDMESLTFHLNAEPRNIFCTKMASKLCRTYTESHGLKAVLHEILGVEISKEQTCSNWGKETLSEEQIEYAASDVIHLHAIKKELEARVVKLDRQDILAEINRFLPTLAKLNLQQWDETIFNHH
ncbi:MAG: ribonuclease D [Proteobacteria bacterium]|nr:ribonuclease D [Pseudomonadota bacterium]